MIAPHVTKELALIHSFYSKVNKDGNVVDDSGDVIAKLTEGEISKCTGKEIDNDGDIINEKGVQVGHVTLIEDIPEPEPEPEEPKETEEEIEARKQIEQDKKLAGQMATCIQQSIDKIKPILDMINEVSGSSLETAPILMSNSTSMPLRNSQRKSLMSKSLLILLSP